MSWAANPLFYRFVIGNPGFYATDRCVGCRKCERVCPRNNIEMVGKYLHALYGMHPSMSGTGDWVAEDIRREKTLL